jgi:asparagine synthase (glutamine-hydrolysing)
VNMFLRYRYTPSPFTLYKGINKLAPGTMLVVGGKGITTKRWYRFTPEPFSPLKQDAQAREELVDIYKHAVKRHLLSDVPVGLLLSGGIDSGLLLGLMNLYGEGWPTYTVGYGQNFKDDELLDAGTTASYYGSKHTSVVVTREEFERTLPNVVRCLEEPVATSSIVPMYLVCKRAREDVKVGLMGQGPDELFGGYKRHLGVRYGAIWRAMPSWLRSATKSILGSLPRNETIKRGIHSLDITNRIKRYQEVFSLLPPERVDCLFLDREAQSPVSELAYRAWEELSEFMKHTDELGGFQFLEIRSSLPDELLMFGDKLSMAHGLEVRVPYLDREVVEYVERLDASYKIRNYTQKWIHRQVCKEFLPAPLLKRKKRGFATNVVDEWFHGSMSSKFDSYFMDTKSLMYDVLQSESVQALLKEHKTGRNDNYKILFSLVVFEEWLRTYKS